MGDQVNDEQDDVDEGECEDDGVGKGLARRPEGVHIGEGDREEHGLREQSGAVNEDAVPDMLWPFHSAKAADPGNLDGEDLQAQADGGEYVPDFMNEYKKEIGEAEIEPLPRVRVHKTGSGRSTGGQRPVDKQLYAAKLSYLKVTRSLIHLRYAKWLRFNTAAQLLAPSAAARV